MTVEYVIKYEYEWFEEGCGCCSSSTSEVHVYETNRTDGTYMSNFYVPLMEDESELREWIADNYPEYNDFVVHEDTRWF